MAGEMARTLSEVLACEARDEALAGVAVVRVELSGSTARVFFTGGFHPLETAKALERASGFLRACLARDMGLAKVPRLIFLPQSPQE